MMAIVRMFRIVKRGKLSAVNNTATYDYDCDLEYVSHP